MTNLNIAPGETFWIRWADENVVGSDDGLAVDDFSLTANPVASPLVDFVKEYRVDGVVNPTSGDLVDVDLYFENGLNIGGSGAIQALIITDKIPSGLTTLDTNFVVDLGDGAVTLTTARDSDAGEIVNGVLVVNVGEVSADTAILISYQATIDTLTTSVTFTSSAGATFAHGDPAETYSASANDSFDAFVTGELAFVVFFDANGNGVQDEGEDGLPDWDFAITGSDIVTTGADGLALFSGFVPGDVDVVVDAAAADGEWSFTEPTTATVEGGTRTEILIAVSCTCNDNSVCTPNDSCDRGVCTFEAPIDCGDSDDPCVASACDAVDGCQDTFTTAACEDGDNTTRDDTCDGAGNCAGTGYSCTPGSCEIMSTPNGVGCDVIREGVGASCNDGDITTRNDQCGASGPCAGTPYTCQASADPCITNVANGTDCTPTPINPGGACNDSNPMTRNDMCDVGGTCTGEVYECPTSNSPCLRNVENGTNCTATPINLGGSCDDGLMTTNSDICDAAGACVGTVYECPTSTNPCITNLPNGIDCTPLATNAGGSCDDGMTNTRLDMCDAVGVCAGTSYNCTASTDPCLVNVPNGSTCTAEPTNLGGTCDDGVTTTRDDACNAAGACTGTTYECPTSTNPCLANVANGTDCTSTPTNSGGSCDDGDTTTRNDVCDAAGGCAGDTFSCDAPANVCRVSTPNGAICVESNAADGGDCDDGDDTTRSDGCLAGACVGTAFTCEPGVCEATSVRNGDGCDVTYEAAATACDDGNSGTKTDVCDGAGACAGEIYICMVEFCEATSVPNGTDCSVTFKADTESCDDDNACTSNDMCSGSGLCVGEVVSCDDGAVCDVDGECVVTHCTDCTVDGDCGVGSACLDLGLEASAVCLAECATDEDCLDEQVCRTLTDKGMFCFDLDGQCEAPPVEPGPDAEVEPGPESVPADLGPESVPTEPGPEVVEAGPDSAAEAVEGEVIWSGGGSSCSGGSPAGAGLMLLALLLLAIRAGHRRLN